MDNPKLIAATYLLLGDGHKLNGDLIKAIDCYLRGIEYYEFADFDSGVATGMINLGGVYRVQGHYKKAIVSYEKAISILNSKNDTFRLAASHNNLGETFRLDGKNSKSLFHFRKSYQLFSSIESRSGIAYSLGNIGLVYAAKNQNDSAEFYIHKASGILEELGDIYPIAVYQTYMADIYKDKGDEKKALEYAHSSLEIAEEEGLKEQIRDASLKLSELYSYTGDYQKAYHYQDQYIIYRDSINNEEVIRKMADLRTEYEISKKETEIDLLEARNENQTLMNYSLAVGVLLLLILGHLIYQNSRKRKEVNHILSEQKEEISAQRDQLEELVNMKDRFFGIISHDLRSPVNSLQGISQLLKISVENKQEDQIPEFVGLADQSINNLSSLLDNLLGWALSQQGSLPYHPEKFDFYYVAEEVKKIFQNAALSKEINLRSDVTKGVKLFADRDGVFALTRNLVNNALKFTRNKGEIAIKTEQTDSHIKIIVEDTGIGIPEEKLKELFVFDKKKSTKGTAGERGSGLGLALCYDIVKLNEGDISVESVINKGTKFIVTLPVEKSTLPS